MKKVAKELKGSYKGIFFAILGIAFAAMADLILPSLFSDIITYINRHPGGDPIPYIKGVGLKMIIIAVITISGAILGNYAAAGVSTALSKNLRSQVFKKVQTFTQVELTEFGTSSLITRNTNDIMQIQMFIGMLLRVFVRAPILMIGGIIMTYSKKPEMARPLLFAVPLILLIVLTVSRFIVPMFSKLQRKLDSINRVFREQISGIRVIRAFGTETYEENRFDEVNKDYRKLNLKMARLMAAMNPLLTIVLNLTIVSVLYLAALNTQGPSPMPEGDIVAIVQYIMQILFSFIMFSIVFVMYPRAQASAKRIYEVLEKNPNIRDLNATKTPNKEISGSLEFRDVSFVFPNATNPTLEGISFRVQPGTTTAIIGSTGSGKTTLLHLILRFYDVTQGAILLDGVDIRELSQHDLRARLGYVPQRWQLFSGSIADNIRFGDNSATEEEMLAAAETAQASDFISEKGGLDSSVAQGGTNFSGGQKQRLSIARAVVKKPEIYLFDDSFSALDSATDANLRTALAEDVSGASQIIVAQRIASIINADQIIVMDSGRIVAKGVHEELMETCQIYREIADSQFEEGEVAVS